MIIARHFVDREKELKLFEQMLVASSGASCLLILDEPGRGKTSLLWRMMEDCRTKHRVPAVLLDFDAARGGVTDYRSAGRRLCDELGRDDFPRFCECDAEVHARSPLVAIGGGEGGGAHVGGDVDTWGGGFTGRDRIQVGDITVTESDAALPHRESWVSDALGMALRDDLVALAEKHERVAILLDTFEQVPEETRKWLLRWLFELLPRLPHLLLVVAGRRERACIEFFERAGPWGDLMELLEALSPFGDDHILHYFRECQRLAVEWEEIATFSDAFRHNPAFMTNAAMLLKQQRTGR